MVGSRIRGRLHDIHEARGAAAVSVGKSFILLLSPSLSQFLFLAIPFGVRFSGCEFKVSGTLEDVLATAFA